MGGIPIFSGALFSLLLWMSSNLGVQNKFLLSSLVILFIIGLRDDLIPMKPRFKLASQLVPILLVSVFSNIQLNSLYSLVDLTFNPVVAIIITVFTLVVITNSFNLIDGIDGLSGTIGSIILITFGTWFFNIELTALSFISFAFVGGLIAFLIYNWSPSRIFMGDTGALLIGFLIGCLTIHFINANFNLPTSNPNKFTGSISTAICILIIPLVDTLRVFFLRVIRLKSPLMADNNHIHHYLLDLGLSHGTSTVLLAVINIGFISLAYFGKDLGDRLLLLIIIIVVSILLLLLNYFSSRKAEA